MQESFIFSCGISFLEASESTICWPFDARTDGPHDLYKMKTFYIFALFTDLPYIFKKMYNLWYSLFTWSIGRIYRLIKESINIQADKN